MHKQSKIDKKALLIRRACADDCDDIWKWRNDPKVRQFSFSQEEILLSDHRKWFDQRIKDKKSVMYLFEDSQGAKIGQVRFQVMPDNIASISVNLNPQYIGQGLGCNVITKATQTLFKENPIIEFIQANVLVNNSVSRKVFEKSGYLLQSQETRQGKEFCNYRCSR